MMWRALSRMVTVRLLLLVAIAAAGPAGVASSWHSIDSVEHRLGLPKDGAPPTFESGALPPGAPTHCPACEFGAALRVWTPSVTTGLQTPVHHASRIGTPSATPLHEIASDTHAGRGPPVHI
jgi:hypothetical protein